MCVCACGNVNNVSGRYCGEDEMLAPEVWTFEPPSNTLKVQEGSIDSCEEVANVIKSHPFNHLVREFKPCLRLWHVLYRVHVKNTARFPAVDDITLVL